MKTRIIRSALFFAALVGVTMFTNPAYAQFGIAAGLNFEQANDIQLTSSEATVDNATGYHFGLFFDLGAGPLAIRPGVFYRQVENMKFSGFNAEAEERTFDLSMIDVPIDVRLRVPVPLVSPYVLAGPVFSFANSDDEDFKESLRDLSMSANIGAGVEIAVPVLGVRVMPELRYNIGISNYVENYEFLGAQVEVEDEPSKLNAFMLRLNVAF